ncbi:MAG: hypothetical protein F4X20_02010 [Dehalococcoidia bacterium]|nr:hypothetical protein [Dehalococcoidia bacterium]
MTTDSAPLRIAVIGSTGSLGQIVLSVARSLGDNVRVVGLAAGSNLERLGEQIREYKPTMAGFARGRWRDEVPEGVEFKSINDIVSSPEVDMAVIASVGRNSLEAAWTAIDAGKRVAIGNIDTLYIAGELLARRAKETGASIFPLDDEPIGVWQTLWGESPESVRQVTMTSTWGTVQARRLPRHGTQMPAGMETPRPARAVGRKRSIDASTLMVKATQVAVVNALYDIPLENINVLFHPQGLVRALTEFNDGSVKSALFIPDMRVPVQLSLAYPNRWANAEINRVDLLAEGRLSFEPLEHELFPCYQIAIDAARQGDTYPAVVAAANDAAIELFISQQIGFTDIPKVIDRAANAHRPQPLDDRASIIEAMDWAKTFVGGQVQD